MMIDDYNDDINDDVDDEIISCHSDPLWASSFQSIGGLISTY